MVVAVFVIDGSEAAFRGFALPPDMPDDPEASWLAIRSAEETKARS